MDNAMLEKYLKLLSSENDAEALMGLRGLQAFFREESTDLNKAVEFSVRRLAELKKESLSLDSIMGEAKRPGPASVSGMPQCRSPKAGCIEIIPPGGARGEIVMVQGEAANHVDDIAGSLKDAIVAAVINKSRFKLKIFDVKNARGETVESVLQAEYEREGMTPVRVWSNVRGEVATLATVLRKAVATAFPELAA